VSRQLISARTTLAVLALAGMALVYAGTARAEKAAPWCAYYTDESTNCGFETFQQCEADISGVGGFCSPNPDGTE
jgi:Protein of unknown function (DUF3551)